MPGGYAVGIDYKAAQGSLIGIAAGQSFGSFKDKTGIGADYDVDSFLAMIYGRMHPFRDSKFTLDGYGAYGRSRFKGDSYMMVPPPMAEQIRTPSAAACAAPGRNVSRSAKPL